MKNKSIKLTKENMKIDLGAIAKGYAADKIVAYLKSEDVKRFSKLRRKYIYFRRW